MTHADLPCPRYEAPGQPTADGHGADAIEDALHARLMALSFHAFLGYVRCALIAMGYSDVRLMSRTAWHQRTAHGGWDIVASARTGVTHSRVIVQAKQYARPVSRRFVDELRGAALRTGADHALIVTTGLFSRTAERVLEADLGHGLLPVAYLDGIGLVRKSIAYGVGALKAPDGSWSLDEAFFACLVECYPGLPRGGRALPARRPRVRRLVGGEHIIFRIAFRAWTLTLTRSVGLRREDE